MIANFGNTLVTEGWGAKVRGGNSGDKGVGTSPDADGFGVNPNSVKGAGAKGIDKIFESGRTPKASELKQYAEAQGWKLAQTDGGPLNYIDENGIPRVTIKQGSSRAQGSTDPHVEFKNETGQRTDAFGNQVARKSPDNHALIDFDL
ncbi:hypothetical protein AB7M22_001709 [Pseudomonas sp. ADAK2 TE3594]